MNVIEAILTAGLKSKHHIWHQSMILRSMKCLLLLRLFHNHQQSNLPADTTDVLGPVIKSAHTLPTPGKQRYTPAYPSYTWKNSRCPINQGHPLLLGNGDRIIKIPTGYGIKSAPSSDDVVNLAYSKWIQMGFRICSSIRGPDILWIYWIWYMLIM